MQNKWFRMGAAAAAVTLAWACGHDEVTNSTFPGAIVGSGVIVSQARPVSGFSALTVNGPLHVVLQQTGSESLVVTADDNVIPVIQSEVRGGRLFLGFAPNTSLTGVKEILCRVTVAEVRDVEGTGAARIDMSDVATAPLGVHLSGASTGTATGTVDQLTLEASGASRWTAGALQSRSVTASVSGASYGLVRARESLLANVSGVSTLEYMGSPTVVPNVDGLSVLRRLGP